MSRRAAWPWTPSRKPAVVDADVDDELELPADVVDGGEVDLVDSEVPDDVVVEDGEVDVVLVVELPEVIEDGEVDLAEALPEVVPEDVDDGPVAAPPPADASCLWSSTLELLDDELLDEEEGPRCGGGVGVSQTRTADQRRT